MARMRDFFIFFAMSDPDEKDIENKLAEIASSALKGEMRVYLKVHTIRDGRKLLKVRIGSRVLIFRQGNYFQNRIVPFVQVGPFGTFCLSWEWGQIEWGLARWVYLHPEDENGL